MSKIAKIPEFNRMKIFVYLFVILFVSSCMKDFIKIESNNKIIAEKFFRGVYGCNPTVVDKYASDSISISYPVFQRLFNKSEIKGKDSVKNFSSGFCSRWENAQITIHESIMEKNKLVMFWSFKARFIGESQLNGLTKNTDHDWGGITIFYFDDEGKVLSEIGEESADGLIYHLKTK